MTGVEKAFNPYRDWLDIRVSGRPPTFYELLGISPDEPDSKRIHRAATNRYQWVLPHLGGEHDSAVRQILVELMNARICLTDPGRRRQYDRTLREYARAIRETTPPAPPRPEPAIAKEPPPIPEIPVIVTKPESEAARMLANREALRAETNRRFEEPEGAGCTIVLLIVVAFFTALGAFASLGEPEGQAGWLFVISMLAVLGILLVKIWTEMWRRG